MLTEIYVSKIDINSWGEEILKTMERPSHCTTPLIEDVDIKLIQRVFTKAINKEFLFTVSYSYQVCYVLLDLFVVSSKAIY
ncbi:MAG: hypothetical protein QXH10_09085 [Ignisphaera sp.]|uniref:Uncharacterized protein n=1 Tax=Ignisphaera aggregans TaxID=334771 RepID=A0A7C4JKM8_9CREN